MGEFASARICILAALDRWPIQRLPPEYRCWSRPAVHSPAEVPPETDDQQLPALPDDLELPLEPDETILDEDFMEQDIPDDDLFDFPGLQ
jgi:hypothetical protein